MGRKPPPQQAPFSTHSCGAKCSVPPTQNVSVEQQEERGEACRGQSHAQTWRSFLIPDTEKKNDAKTNEQTKK